MRWRNGSSVRPVPGFVEPCLPTLSKQQPAGPNWVYELNHDGYRLLVRKAGTDVRVYTKRGADFTDRCPHLVEAARKLRAVSALLDGEGIAYDQIGMPSFALIHSREYDRYVSLIAFDLLEKDGEDLRPLPLVAANGGCSTW
jgi:bifunctional non-homologous end joining protein LigD